MLQAEAALAVVHTAQVEVVQAPQAAGPVLQVAGQALQVAEAHHQVQGDNNCHM